MSGSYESDRGWADSYLPAVKHIVGPFLLAPAPFERDANEATDLIVLRARDMSIGVRLRRPGYAGRYPGQFTIRSGRPSRVPTELRKIVDGWGDWLFYGHAGQANSITEWLLVDLHALRAAFIRFPKLLHQPDDRVSGERVNHDGTVFRWFQADNLPCEVVIAREPRIKVAA
jgi:hypothetical protein